MLKEKVLLGFFKENALVGKKYLSIQTKCFVPVVLKQKFDKALEHKNKRIKKLLQIIRAYQKVISLEWLEKTAFELKSEEFELPRDSDYAKAWNDGFGTAMRRIVLAAKTEFIKVAKKKAGEKK